MCCGLNAPGTFRAYGISFYPTKNHLKIKLKIGRRAERKRVRVASSANLRGKNWGVSVGDASPTVRFPQDFHLFVGDLAR